MSSEFENYIYRILHYLARFAFFLLLLISVPALSQPTSPPSSVVQKTDFKPLQIGIRGGFSYLLGKAPENYLNSYYKELKTGHHFGGELAYFFNPYLGVGAKYTAFRTKNAMEVPVVPHPHGSNQMVEVFRDDIQTHYIGPAFVTRLLSESGKVALKTAVSLGYVYYVNNAKFYGSSTKITGSTVGLALELGPDLYLDQNLSVGISVGMMMGFLSKAELKSPFGKQILELNEPDNLSRLDLAVTLRWNM